MRRMLMIIIAVFAIVTAASAQNYSHERICVGSAGGKSTSGSMINYAIIGQISIGQISDGVYSSNAGFYGGFDWYTFVKETGNLPFTFNLSQNYPNPFNPATMIDFTIPEAVPVKLEIYNILGQLVSTLADNEFQAGPHSIVWKATGVSSGVYIYRLSAGDFTDMKKMTLIR